MLSRESGKTQLYMLITQSRHQALANLVSYHHPLCASVSLSEMGTVNSAYCMGAAMRIK